MKVIKFSSNLVPLVLSGEKTRTWRFFDDKNLSVGDELSLVNKQTLSEFAKAKIIFVKEKKFSDLTDIDFLGHELFKSTDEMYKTYQSYYGDRIVPETVIKIIDFEVLSTNNR